MIKRYRCDECAQTWWRLWFQAPPESVHMLWPWGGRYVPPPPPVLGIRIWCGPVRPMEVP